MVGGGNWDTQPPTTHHLLLPPPINKIFSKDNSFLPPNIHTGFMNKQNQSSNLPDPVSGEGANKKGFRQKWNYVKGEFRQFQSDFPKIALSVKALGGLIVAGFLFLMTFFLMIYFGTFGKIPTALELKDIRNHEASEIYSSDGVLLGKYYIENREIVGLDDISPDIINALIATEDARFFKHKGIDVRAFLRVFFRTILLGDESAGGGSTLSQQLAKNIYSRKTPSLFFHSYQ